MTSHNIPTYSELFGGPVPQPDELIRDIPSVFLVYTLSRYNMELYHDPQSEETQKNILYDWLAHLPKQEVLYFMQHLLQFQAQLPNGSIVSWFARRYMIPYLEVVLKNYNHHPPRALTVDEIKRTLMAYFAVVEACHQQDDRTFDNLNGAADSSELEQLNRVSWAFFLPQYEFNQRPNTATELVKIFGIITYLANSLHLVRYFDAFLLRNDFPTAGHFIKSIAQITVLLDENYSRNTFPRRDTRIHASSKALRLDNLSLDPEVYKKEYNRENNYKYFRERPLFKLNETDYLVFDLGFWGAAITTGFLFELYYQTDLKSDPRYPTFDRFKSEISKSVLEEKVFKGMLEHCFAHQARVLYFENNERISIPDAFLQLDFDVFFIEFKDYLVRGDIYQSYDYDTIKKVIDQKLAAPDKGVYQLKKQILNYCEGKFRFAAPPEERIKLYPILTHTNFVFSLPGIQQYLNHLLQESLAGLLPLSVDLQELVLINWETFVFNFEDFRQNKNAFVDLLQAYYGRVAKDRARFSYEKNLPNYLKAYRSFDMDYDEHLIGTRTQLQKGFMEVITNVSGVSQEILNHQPAADI